MSILRSNRLSLLQLLLFCCGMSALWRATAGAEQPKIRQSPVEGELTLRLEESAFLSLEACRLDDDDSYTLEVEVSFDGGMLRGGTHGSESLSYNDAETSNGCAATIWDSGDRCRDLVARIVNSPLHAHREVQVDLVLRQTRDNVLHVITRSSFNIRMLKGDEEEEATTTITKTATTETAESAKTTAETTDAETDAAGVIGATATTDALSPGGVDNMAIGGDSPTTIIIVAGVAGGVLLLVIVGIVGTVVARRCRRRRAAAYLGSGGDAEAKVAATSSTSLDKPRELSPASRALSHVNSVSTDLAE